MKKGIYILLVLLAALLLSSCGKKEKKQEEDMHGKIWIYYINPTEDGFVKVAQSLTQPDNVEKSVNEVLFYLSDTEGANTSKYKALMPDVTVQSIEYTDRNVNLDFGAAYNNLSRINEITARISIVKSLLQIHGVDSVTFTVNGVDLIGTDETPVGPMKKESFLIEGEKDVYSLEKKVTLYYSDNKGRKLIPYETVITSRTNEPIEKLVLEALLEEPKYTWKEKLISPLPKGLSINRIQVVDNTCYVDLSKEIENVIPGVEEKITIYAMVHTLSALNSAYQIRFTVDGEKRETLNNLDNFGGTFSVMPELNKE